MVAASSLLHLSVVSAALAQVVGTSPWTTSSLPSGTPRPTTTSLSCATVKCPRPMVMRPNPATFECKIHPSRCSASQCCAMPIEAVGGIGTAPHTPQTCWAFACPKQMFSKPKSDTLLCPGSEGCSVGFCCLNQATLALTTTPISVIEARLFSVHRRHEADKVDASLQKESDAKMMPIYVVVLLSIGCLGMAVAASACRKRRQKTTYRFNIGSAAETDVDATAETDLEADFEGEDRTPSSTYSKSVLLIS